MAEEAAPSTDEGQAADAGTTESTGAAPDTGAGQADASAGKGTSGTTRDAAPASQDTDQSFFDPKKVPAELQPAYKQMQGAFTKAMQTLATQRNKVNFYDQFAADPVANMQRLASQYGYQLTRAQAQAAINQQEQQGGLPEDYQPKNWNEVFQKGAEFAKQQLMQELSPLINEVRQTKKQNIERQLSDIDPAWQQYEPEMIELINQVPGLAAHPEKLYRLAVPAEVVEQRATQKALQRLEAKAKATAASGGSTTNKRPSVLDHDQKFTSVQEAAAWAQRKLEEEGKWPPKK